MLPLVLAGILAATSIPIRLGSRAASRAAGRAQAFVFVALVVQAATSAMQVHEMSSDLDRFTPHGSAYASIYYTLLGARHAHVAVGLLLSAWLLLRLIGGLTRYRARRDAAIAFYWYAVNVITVVVTVCTLARAMRARRQEFLQWFGLLGRPSRGRCSSSSASA